VGEELFHAGRQTDRHRQMGTTKLKVTSRNSANEP